MSSIFFKYSTHIGSENKDEKGSEVKAETFMAEGEGRLEPGTEAEQSRPVQPDGSSSHTEVLTTTPEPEVNEVKRICIHSLSLKKNRRFLKGNDVIFY